MMEIYFDDILINEDYYTELSTNFSLFEDSFYLGSTASNIYNISIAKDVITKHPDLVVVKENGIVIAKLVVDKIEENDFEYKYTLTDKMINLEFDYDATSIFHNGSATLLEIVQDICRKAGIELATTDFRGNNKNISWYDNTITAREYIGYVAELNGGYAQIGKDGKLYFIKQNTLTSKTINIDDCSDFKVGEKHIITRVIYEQGALKYEYGNETGNTLYLNSDNVFITEQIEVEEIFNEINGFEFYSFSTENCPIDYKIMPGQIVTFTDGINNYPTIVGYDLTYNGGWYGGYNLDVATKKQEETKTKGTNDKIKKLLIEVDRANNKITQVVQETDKQNQKITQVTQTIEEVSQEVNSITGENSIKNGDFTSELQNWLTSALGGTIEIKTLNDKKYANLLSMYDTTMIEQIVSGLFADIEYTLAFDIFDDNAYDISVADNAVFSIEISQNITQEEMQVVHTEEIQVTQTNTRKNIKFKLNKNSQNVSIAFKLKANGYLPDTASVLLGDVVLSGGDITEKLAKLNINSDEISSEVKKKVGDNEIISKINQSSEAVGINADKIELSANDILNLLAGNAINLGSKKITIKSDNFNVDEDGNMSCNNAIINNAKIKNGNIEMIGDELTPTVNIKDYQGDTIEMYPSNINMVYKYLDNTIGIYLQKGGLYIESSNGNYIKLDANEGFIEIKTNGTIKRITGNG